VNTLKAIELSSIDEDGLVRFEWATESILL
jgi:hypothetical protein